MFKIIRIINCFLAIILSCLIISEDHSQINAAGDWKGYAVYRGGVVAATYEYHAGLMYGTTRTSNQYPVIHIGGYNQTVSHVTWAAFIDGNPYIGIRQPSGCGMDATTRNLFIYRANLLLGKPYTVVNQIYYDLTSSSTYVYPSVINSIRCDGVVEYTYEWYGYRVGGPDNYWNITINATANLNAHAGLNITPKKQCNNLLAYSSNGYPD